MYIKEAEFELQREPFAQPFAFKGASFREKWNLVVRLRSEGGPWVYGMGGLAVLWSSVSHWILGIPYDSILRARRGKPENALDDLHDMAIPGRLPHRGGSLASHPSVDLGTRRMWRRRPR